MISSLPRRLISLPTIRKQTCSRWNSTLQGRPYIHVFPNPLLSPSSHILSLLPTIPPTKNLSIGVTTELPPTPDSFSENPRFLSILNEVLAKHAHHDPGVISQAQAMASTGGSSLGSGGAFFPSQRSTGRKDHVGGGGAGGDGAGGASSQGGAGGGGRGGFIHVFDARNPPDYGRIPFPEDIFGSLEVDGQGNFAGGDGSYQASGTYRIVTREGILGLSSFLREKLAGRLSEIESFGA